jgi:SAM-dependent methyltransferase
MDLSNLTLNAGCGTKAWGDLRVDIQTFSDIYYLKKTSANMIASIEHLPFRDGSFKEVRCLHVLEHVDRPLNCLRELKRVANGRILIRVPVNGMDYFKDHLYKVRSWKLRYTGHKWYIKGRKINRVYWILPLEYEIELYVFDTWLDVDLSKLISSKAKGFLLIYT